MRRHIIGGFILASALITGNAYGQPVPGPVPCRAVFCTASATGTGSIGVLQNNPTINNGVLNSPTMVTPVLGVATATGLTVSPTNATGNAVVISPQQGDINSSTTALAIAPTMAAITSNNTNTIAIRGIMLQPHIGATNTKNITGGVGDVAITIGAVIDNGATGTLSNWNGETISFTNNASATMGVTTAIGFTVNNYNFSGGGTGVAVSAIGGYFKDQSNGTTCNTALLVGGTTATPTCSISYSLHVQAGNLVQIDPAATFAGSVTLAGGAQLLLTTNTLTNGAAAAVGTLLNAPVAGNPTKWVAINDAGTVRYIPAW